MENAFKGISWVATFIVASKRMGWGTCPEYVEHRFAALRAAGLDQHFLGVSKFHVCMAGAKNARKVA